MRYNILSAFLSPKFFLSFGFAFLLALYPLSKIFAQTNNNIELNQKPSQCQGEFIQGGVFLCQGTPEQMFYLTEAQTLPKDLSAGKAYQLNPKKTFRKFFSKRTYLAVKSNSKGLALMGLHRTAPPYVIILSKIALPSSADTDQVDSRLQNTLYQIRIHPVKQRQYKIDRINGLPERTVTPKTDQQIKKIKQDSRLKRKAYQSRLNHDGFLKGFIPPAKGRISGVYGSQRILNGKPRMPHYGVDYAAPVGTKVIAPAPGLVILAQSGFYYEGGLVFIDHGQGLISAFLHMKSVMVKTGDRISTGDQIGTIGAEGRATGPHLDWRIKWRKRQIDPDILLDMTEFLQKHSD